MHTMSRCDCGAFDCPRCRPGCLDPVECGLCGNSAPKWIAEQEWELMDGAWVCADCAERDGEG